MLLIKFALVANTRDLNKLKHFFWMWNLCVFSRVVSTFFYRIKPSLDNRPLFDSIYLL